MRTDVAERVLVLGERLLAFPSLFRTASSACLPNGPLSVPTEPLMQKEREEMRTRSKIYPSSAASTSPSKARANRPPQGSSLVMQTNIPASFSTGSSKIENSASIPKGSVELLQQRLQSIAFTMSTALSNHSPKSAEERRIVEFCTKQLESMLPAAATTKRPTVIHQPPNLPELGYLPGMVSTLTLWYGRVLCSYRNSHIRGLQQHGASPLPPAVEEEDYGRICHDHAVQWLVSSSSSSSACAPTETDAAKVSPPGISNVCSPPARSGPTGKGANDFVDSTNAATSGTNNSTPETDDRMKAVLELRAQRRKKLVVARGLLVSFCHASRCTVPNCTFTENCAAFKVIWKHIIDTEASGNAKNCCSNPCCVQGKAALRHFKRCKAPTCALCGPLLKSLSRLIKDTEENNNRQQQSTATTTTFPGK